MKMLILAGMVYVVNAHAITLEEICPKMGAEIASMQQERQAGNKTYKDRETLAATNDALIVELSKDQDPAMVWLLANAATFMEESLFKFPVNEDSKVVGAAAEKSCRTRNWAPPQELQNKPKNKPRLII